MGRQKLILDINDLEKLSDLQLRQIDKAVLATAFKVRDEARNIFRSLASIYKHHNPSLDYNGLANGIMVGKLRESKVKIQSLGTKSDYESYKTRFFVGGTKYRLQKKYKGTRLQKPYTKGYIKPNDSVDKAVADATSTLTTYIRNAINE